MLCNGMYNDYNLVGKRDIWYIGNEIIRHR